MSVLANMGSQLTRRFGEVLIDLPARAKRGEVIEIRALILHPSQNQSAESEKIFIEEVAVDFDGKTFCHFDWSSMISPNPQLAVPLRAEKSGLIKVRWRNNRGQTSSGEKSLRVDD